MKSTRLLIIGMGAISAAVSAWSQAIQFVDITRQANFVQTGPSTVSADPTTPFIFRAAVEGDNSTTISTPLTAASFTPPGGSSTSLSFNSSGHRWYWEDTSQTSMNNLNTVYGTGGYAFVLTGTPNGTPSVTVSSFASSQLQTPQLTLSGGSWVGSSYQMNAGSALTISFNALFVDTPSVISGTTTGFHYDAEVNGNSFQSVDDFINYNPTTAAAATYTTTPPNFVTSALAAGNYTVQVSFDEIQNPATGTYASAFAASLLEYRTTINLTVIPEPSTYAALFGAVALAGVVIRRRRRLA